MPHTPSAIDAEFARFQRDGAPEALAAVFDATAPRLLLVAMHLCRDAQTAEDLVQTVFLQAMRDASSYDPARPVLPWLLKMLEHRAADRRDRAFVRRERGGIDLSQTVGGAADPAREAAGRELREQFAAALDALPPSHREVVTLRLVHGLRAVDIAHAQGTSPATIRTRLRRGLAQLREALPRGVATSGLLAVLSAEWLRARDALPEIRRLLLAKATPPTVAMATGATLTGSLLKWASMLAVAALVLTLAAQQLLQGDVVTPVQAGRDAAVATADLGARADAPAGDAPAERQAVTANTSATDSLDDAITRMRGRLVSKPTSTPLAGAEVRLHFWARRSAPPPVPWVAPEPVRTDADGRFELAFVPPDDRGFELQFAAEGHVEDGLGFDSLRQAIEVPLGEIALEPGTDVRIRVLADGKPLAGVEVALSRAAIDPDEAPDYTQADTDAVGVAHFGVCGAGEWRYHIRTQWAGPTTGSVSVALSPGGVERLVELQRPADDRSLSGLVVDERGVPVGGVPLKLQRPGHPGWRPTTTDDDGSFFYALPLPADPNPPQQLLLAPERTDLELLDDGGEVRFGQHGVRIVVRRHPSATARVEVVDAATGAPIEHFGVRCIPDPWAHVGQSVSLAELAIERHADGVATFSDLRPAPYRVTVRGPEPYAMRSDLQLDVRPGAAATLRVELSPTELLSVHVVDRDGGAPLADVDVRLACVAPPEALDEIDEHDLQQLFELACRGGWSSHHNVRILDHARSDADGNVRLRVTTATPHLLLVAQARHCRDEWLHDVTPPPAGQPLTVQVSRAARLHGTLGPTSFVTRFGPSPEQLAEAAEEERFQLHDPERFVDDRPSIVLRTIGDDETRYETHVDEQGRFAIDAIAAGDYEVWCHADLSLGPRHGAQHAFGPLTTVHLQRDSDVELPLDVRDLLPGRASARFFVDGQPWRGTAGFAQVVDGSTVGVVAAADADGVFRSPWMLPGRYLPFVELDRGDSLMKRIYGTAPFDVATDGDVSVTADLHHRVVVVTLLEADGSPAIGRRVVPVSVGYPELAFDWRWGARTDEHGRATFDPAPPGLLRIALAEVLLGDDKDTVTPGATLAELLPTQHEVTVRLPVGERRRD
ncbi:MAG: sigma-70 family RNA polymerase sigma factor [Planctomycetota bacterium]